MINKEYSADIAIVGAGIVGLAHAYMALRKGHKVVLFERERFAVGASVRNFGLLWPIGQEPGVGLDRALRSRQHWIEVAEQAGCWINRNGSLHVAYLDTEWDVLNEFVERFATKADYQVELLDPVKARERSFVLNPFNLKGGLWSETECTVNPREAIRKLPQWLEEKYGLTLRFGQAIREISFPKVKTAYETWSVNKVFVCSGADFETLYPEVYTRHAVTKSKLQMMKAVTKENFLLGPTLCAGLTLRHYSAFSKCPSLLKLNDHYDRENSKLKENGVHVLLAQNNYGELIIGDSHHYGLTIEPFESEEVNTMILDYLDTFTRHMDYRIAERWHGVYPKLQDGIDLIVDPEPGVTIVNCLGGAGMTLSFGLAEEIINAL